MEHLNRQEMRDLVEKLMNGHYSDEEELDRDASRLKNSVVFPDVLDLIFYPDKYFDRYPTPDEIVDRALSYRPIEL